MGDPFQNDPVVLNDGVTMSVASKSDTTVIDAKSIPPFDPDQRILWAVKRGIQLALGDSTLAEIQAALPDPSSTNDMFEFLAGVVLGVRDSIADLIAQNLQAVAQAGLLVIGFYRLVFDLDLWVELEKVYTDDPYSDLGDFRQYLQSNYPLLLDGLTSLPLLKARYDDFVKQFTAKEIPGPWPTGAYVIANWVASFANLIGTQLQPQLAAIVASKGKPADQGQIIGKTVCDIIVAVVSIAMGLFAILQGIVGVSRGIFLGVKLALEDLTLARTADRLLTDAVPAALDAGAQASKSMKETVKIYGDLAYKVSPYKDLLRETGSFNKTVRDISGYGVFDIEYQSMRLDAHHLVEDTWYNKRFGPDFLKVFGWKSSKEMDSMALHYEWHIRSGAQMSEKLGYLGAENKVSLTKALQDYLADAQKTKPFGKLSDLVQAHADFYKGYSTPLWKKVEPWFVQTLAKIQTAGL